MTTTQEKKIGYKKLDGGLIAVLEIMGENNEERDGIYDTLHAKHRCSEAMVLEIYHSDDKDKKKLKGVSMHDYRFVYKVGKVVKVDNYDKNLNEPCSSGIHYFLTEECARLYRVPYAKSWYCNGRLMWETVPLGEGYSQHTRWDEDGNVKESGKEKDGEREGEWVIIHNWGIKIESRGCYKNGEKEGWWTEVDSEGNKIVERYFVDGICRNINDYHDNGRLKSVTYYNVQQCLHGNYKEWYDNGEVKTIGEYDRNMKVGEWVELYSDGAYKSVKNYEKDRLNGEYKRYYENGNLKLLGKYKNNKKCGVWTYFNEKGQVRSQKKFVKYIRRGKGHNKN